MSTRHFRAVVGTSLLIAPLALGCASKQRVNVRPPEQPEGPVVNEAPVSEPTEPGTEPEPTPEPTVNTAEAPEPEPEPKHVNVRPPTKR
jgi:outer membrane biosynthesis protein TonB